MKNIAQDKLNNMIENIIKKIEENDTGKWFKAWSEAGLPINYATNTNYNGFNIISLMCEAVEKNYKTNNWLTFNQIKALKATVKKGEKSTPIFFFKPLKKKEEIIEKGETVEKEKTVLLLKTYNVFNIDQTDIESDSQISETKQDIEEFINNIEIEIKTAQNAYYKPESDYIGIPNINSFDSVDNYYSVLFHEIGHATGHKNRLDRDLTGNFGDISYSKEELIAELSSVFLCSHLSIESSIRHEAYLKSWLQGAKEDPKFLWKSASEASKVLNYCIEKQKEKESAA
jgi:antirestriction protein ArdC